jgi:uncharacterized SAM-binding protein YcdF (DUF218 family)
MQGIKPVRGLTSAGLAFAAGCETAGKLPCSPVVTRKRKWFLRSGLAFLAFLLLLAATAILFPQQFLCVDSGPVKGDVIVVLGGGVHERPERAAEFFKERIAPRIIVSGLGDCKSGCKLLIEAGVPSDVIEMEEQSRTTKENAQFAIQLLRKLNSPPVKRVIIVTSWYHSRRALACFRHYAPDIQFYSRPSYFAYARADWSHNRIGNRVRLEYAKLFGYWIRYGVWPF